MSTIFGRYRYLVVPYGSIYSQDTFQATKMYQILEGLKGVVSIANDVAVIRVTEGQHDNNVRKHMKRAHENGLIFNPDKCSL